MSKPFLSDIAVSSDDSQQQIFCVERRGIKSGCINIGSPQADVTLNEKMQRWKANEPIVLEKFLSNSLGEYSQDIDSSESLYRALLDGTEIDELLDQPKYLSRFGEKFELLSTRFDESDPQELISVDFDVIENGELVMEDIWIRISWLSFLEVDESLRFRFSFGMEGFDDVSLDLERQLAAAELCDKVFPESAIVCNNEALRRLITDIAGVQNLRYLERIVYYNANKGGAQFHHDAEKGHLGVVYAQLTGQTLWLALSKMQLMSEIQLFLADEENKKELESVVKLESGYAQLLESANDFELLGNLLDDPANEAISEFLNESVLFFNQLVNKGYAYVLKPGDVILLPQQSMENCAWHSVFCLGEKAGQALSFAIKDVKALT